MIGETLKRYWLRHAIDFEQGVAESELDSFESKYNLSLRSDLRDYFLHVNGMPAGVSDEALIRFWMLKEVKPISEDAPEYDDPKYIKDRNSVFLFADYCIWSHAYGIHLSAKNSTQQNQGFVIGYSPSIVQARLSGVQKPEQTLLSQL